jgi:hypothetical protein
LPSAFDAGLNTIHGQGMMLPFGLVAVGHSVAIKKESHVNYVVNHERGLIDIIRMEIR